MNGKGASVRNKGFTLIELLIVVAIIAILAAIAVPNFLEAQVRSKVSRAHADMRTLSTALESYAVDHNRVPLGSYEVQLHFPQPQTPDEWANHYLQIWSVLTTPVSYITSIPRDPFRDKGAVSKSGTLSLDRPWYDYQSYCDDRMVPLVQQIRGWGYTWSLCSCGPFRHSNVNMVYLLSGQILVNNATAQFVYDATNGTVSRGIILRSNKGICKGPNT